jgi:hypothetical protein
MRDLPAHDATCDHTEDEDCDDGNQSDQPVL